VRSIEEGVKRKATRTRTRTRTRTSEDDTVFKDVAQTETEKQSAKLLLVVVVVVSIFLPRLPQANAPCDTTIEKFLALLWLFFLCPCPCPCPSPSNSVSRLIVYCFWSPSPSLPVFKFSCCFTKFFSLHFLPAPLTSSSSSSSLPLADCYTAAFNARQKLANFQLSSTLCPFAFAFTFCVYVYVYLVSLFYQGN